MMRFWVILFSLLLSAISVYADEIPTTALPTAVASPTPIPEAPTLSDLTAQTDEPKIQSPWAITTSITVPQPLTLGFERKLDAINRMSAFFEGGWFKYSFGENKSRSVSDYTLVGGVRYHPFLNWFTVTGELGYRHIGVTVDISNMKMDGQSLANSAEMNVNALFAGVLVGGQWFLSQRIAIAFDVGLQFSVPLAHGGAVNIIQTADQVDGSDLTVDDEEAMKRISGIPIPQIALLRFVWYI